MEEYWHVILEALIDTAKLLPILFIVYYLIELIEFKYAIKFQNNKWLKGKASPVIGAVIGCVPQCGFSVVTTDLFTKRAVSIGALLAVYIATSDEAVPLMLSNPSSIPWLLALIGVKIVFAILIGYLSIWLYNIIFKNSNKAINNENLDNHSHEKEELSNQNLVPHDSMVKDEIIVEGHSHDGHLHDDENLEQEIVQETHGG